MQRTERSTASLRQLAFQFSLLVLITSMIDLFVNRLIFGGGPDTLAHLSFPGISNFAIIGRISFSFEQLALFAILGAAAAVLLQENRILARLLGLLLVPQLFSAALLYFNPSFSLSFDLSIILVLTTVAVVFGLVISAMKTQLFQGRGRYPQFVFLALLGSSFFFPLYYRFYFLMTSMNYSLPFGFDAYTAGVFSIMVTSIAVFLYAVMAPSSRFRIGLKNFVLAAILPTLLIAPIFYGMTQSFLMVQIFSLVIAMSTNITLSFEYVQAIVIFWWFLLMAIVILMLKGRSPGDRFLLQQGVGLIFLMSTTFLFTYPSYLLLGTAGVLLLCYPLRQNPDQQVR